MDPHVLLIANAGDQKAQVLFGETITLGGVDHTCSESTNATADLLFEEGGASEMLRASVIVTKTNLAVPPERGTPAVFRGNAYRVTLVTDMVVRWEIRLVQQFA